MLLGVIVLLLPAAVANMAPVVASRIPILAFPVDGGLHFRGKRLLGDNKTVRGFVFGVFAAIVVSALEIAMADPLAPYALVDYSAISPLTFGILSGLGALLGDALKSFCKRQVGIPPGEHFIPFDQLDWIIGTFIALIPLAVFSPAIYALGMIIGGCLHPLANILGYYLGLKRNMF